jgi:DNA-binding MarR family transcriptional regulator
LRRLSETLYAGVDEVYRAEGVTLSSRSFPILFLLRDDGSLSITELAARLGQSHPAAIQMSRKLIEEGLVTETHDPADERRRLLVLSRKGRALMARMEPVWRAIVGAVDALAATAGADLLGAVSAFERALAERGFAARIGELLRLQASEAVEIIPYEERYQEDFKRLNVEWLERYFYVEAIDHDVLSRPEVHIIEPGGFIFLARYNDEIVGSCALIRHPQRRFELSKMAVTERYRGLRIGYKLLRAAIAQFRALGANQLFLETSTKLEAAIRLYQANGFCHAPPPKGATHYRRSDVYMVYQGRGAAAKTKASGSRRRAR